MCIRDSGFQHYRVIQRLPGRIDPGVPAPPAARRLAGGIHCPHRAEFIQVCLCLLYTSGALDPDRLHRRRLAGAGHAAAARPRLQDRRHGVDPVSYTHLDVYKRQGLPLSITAAQREYLNRGIRLLPQHSSTRIGGAGSRRLCARCV